MQSDTFPFDILDDSHHLLTMLEQHHVTHPAMSEALSRHRALHDTLTEQWQIGEHALEEWRTALAQRWECEIGVQRLCANIQRQLYDYFGADAHFFEIIAPATEGQPRTANDLLADLRRLKASLALIQPQPPFASEWLPRLATASAELSAALAQTVQCETQRRRALVGRRLIGNAYQRAREQTYRLLGEYLGEELIIESNRRLESPASLEIVETGKNPD
jgi:hypothetical protein